MILKLELKTEIQKRGVMFQKNRKQKSPMVDFYGNCHSRREKVKVVVLSPEFIGSSERISDVPAYFNSPSIFSIKLPEEPLW